MKNISTKIAIIALIFIELSICRIYAQADTTSLKKNNPKQAEFTVPKVQSIKAVYDYPIQKAEAKEESKPVVAYPGTIVKFTITNPTEFLKSRPTDQSKVALYVNGIEMKGITSDWMDQIKNIQVNAGQIPLLSQTADIYVSLKRTETTQDAWHYLYNSSNHFYSRTAEIDASIGWEGMSDLPKSENLPKLSIVFYTKTIFVAWACLFLCVILLFIKIAFFTDALRENGKSSAYSLSVTQLLFWTTLTLFAFIYCTVLTDITTSFNPSILLLLGISMGTSSIAYLVDSNFNYNNSNAQQKVHKSFLQDILSDIHGYSMHRIQVFAWNLVLGMYFIIYTFSNKSMPEFSTTLLFLAGISSASYLAAKGPENINSKTPPTSSPPN